nr:MAG: putative serine protease [Culex-associated Luteo-like virus]
MYFAMCYTAAHMMLEVTLIYALYLAKAENERLVRMLERPAPMQALLEIMSDSTVFAVLAILSITSLVIHTYKTISWFFRKTSTAFKFAYYWLKSGVHIPTVDSLYRPERYMEGSEAIKIFNRPNFQVFLYGYDGKSYKYVGSGFRYQDFLVTSLHVIDEYKCIQVRKLRGEGKGFEILRDDFTSGECDLTWSLVDPREWSKLGVSTARLVATMPAKIQASVNDGLQLTQGSVSKLPVFGYVSYSGSTWPGFSGAPYYVNNQVYAMHVGSGGVNLGISSSYIRALLRMEDSYDFVLQDIKATARQRKFKARVSPTDPLERLVEHNGRMYVFDREDLVDVEQYLDWNDEVNYSRESMSYPDHGPVERPADVIRQRETAPAPSIPPVARPRTSVGSEEILSAPEPEGNVNRASASAEARGNHSRLGVAPNGNASARPASTIPLEPRVIVTNGPTLTPAPPSVVSVSTSTGSWRRKKPVRPARLEPGASTALRRDAVVGSAQ